LVKENELPPRTSQNYHPLQNILRGSGLLKHHKRTFWEEGSTLAIGEGRVTSKSKRNVFKSLMPDKPIRYSALRFLNCVLCWIFLEKSVSESTIKLDGIELKRKEEVIH
jgi:hypothetical protein